MTRHLLDIDDLTHDELDTILSVATEYKAAFRDGVTHTDLAQQSLGMLFQQPSTRTRVSFETGMTQLGGHAVFLGEDDLQLGRGEPLKDTARALSRYVDVLLARVFTHANVETLAAYADVPVINGLTDDAHPCQTLADLLTIRELHGDSERVAATWIGDGNNVAQSFALGCALAGIDLTVATPDGYGLDDDVVARARDLGGDPTLVDDPETALQGADVVYTDVWVSMGRTDERDVRRADFEGYQLDEDRLAAAGEADVMHCLPAHRGEEITDAVLESDRAAIWRQAENRLHAQKGLLVWLSRQH
jgi:ornithine carbamoyltransferase